MAKFDSKTINLGIVEYTTSTVYVYSSAHERGGLCLPCGTVMDARWVGPQCRFRCPMAGLTFTKDLAIISVAGCDRIAKNIIFV
jgi:hypothetical protein